jgi:TolB protein
MKKLNTLLFSASLALLAGAAHAQLHVEIAGVGNNQIPVAVAQFADEGVAPQQVSAIIRADLERSGMFKVIDARQVIPETAAIDFAAWKSSGAEAVVVGSVQKLADGRLAVRYKLLDTVKGGQLSSMSDAVQPKSTRLEAHRIADDVYEKLTGVPGIFATRIAYVAEPRRGKDWELNVADADGENVIHAFHSHQPIISPAWSPDGTKVAYVSYHQNKPIIYIQDLISGSVRLLSNQKGNNSAPAWAPDSATIAMALSKDGNTEVYSISADGSNLRRLTNSPSIDTEPRYSPDGQTIYFTSDRSGNAQIYKMDASGGNPARLTFAGTQNFSPRIAPDGKTLAYISQRNGVYSLYVMDLASGQELRLADDAGEPSFAPNGKYIMYRTGSTDQRTLAVVSVDGRVKQRLTTQAGNIKEPSWGPFMK